MDDVTNSHEIKTYGPYPFSGPIAGATENRAAHGNVCFRDERSDGAQRWRNVNGSHHEVGPWLVSHGDSPR